MEFNLASILMFFVAGFGFVFVTLTFARIFRPHNPIPGKGDIYECGERPIGEAWMQFNPRFYLVALTFLIFDVEIVFIFPIATVFKKYVAAGSSFAWLAFAELFIFMAILLLGLVYVWVKGDLVWVKKLREQPEP